MIQKLVYSDVIVALPIRGLAGRFLLHAGWVFLTKEGKKQHKTCSV